MFDSRSYNRNAIQCYKRRVIDLSNQIPNRLFPECDYFNDKRDSIYAKDTCAECYRYATCLDAYKSQNPDAVISEDEVGIKETKKIYKSVIKFKDGSTQSINQKGHTSPVEAMKSLLTPHSEVPEFACVGLGDKNKGAWFYRVENVNYVTIEEAGEYEDYEDYEED